MTGYDPPADLDAERYVLGSMMHAPHAIEAAIELLEPQHFHRPAHEVLFRAMIAMHAADIRVDPLTLRHELEAHNETRVLGGKGPLYLIELFELPVTPVSMPHYARLVLAAALRRRLIEEASRLDQAGRMPSTDPDDILTRIDERLEALRRSAILHPSARTDFQAVTEGAAKEHRPLIDGLLGEQERVVVVGGEGRGKTTLAHQVGFALAAGCHPFAWNTRIQPRRVFIADFENPEDELSRRFTALGEIAARYPGWSEERLSFYLRQDAPVLSNAREAFTLMDQIRRHEPGLVIAGPIYKLIDAMVETGVEPLHAHSRVTTFFDRVRQRYGSAIWLETHAPYGAAGKTREMRPEGSNVWVKWPEFRLALYKAGKDHGGDTALEVRRFGGDRIAGRVWPDWLTRNEAAYSSGWPWRPNYNRNVFQQEMT